MANIYVAGKNLTRAQAGMAMGLNKLIIVSGFTKKLFFLSLPEITCVKNDDEILAALKLKNL